jgi:hypothetical protein
VAIGKSILHSSTKYCHLKLFIKIFFLKQFLGSAPLIWRMPRSVHVKDNLQQCASVIILWHRTTYHSHGHNEGFKIGEAGVWRPPDEAEKCE